MSLRSIQIFLAATAAAAGGPLEDSLQAALRPLPAAREVRKRQERTAVRIAARSASRTPPGRSRQLRAGSFAQLPAEAAEADAGEAPACLPLSGRSGGRSCGQPPGPSGQPSGGRAGLRMAGRPAVSFSRPTRPRVPASGLPGQGQEENQSEANQLLAASYRHHPAFVALPVGDRRPSAPSSLVREPRPIPPVTFKQALRSRRRKLQMAPKPPCPLFRPHPPLLHDHAKQNQARTTSPCAHLRSILASSCLLTLQSSRVKSTV